MADHVSRPADIEGPVGMPGAETTPEMRAWVYAQLASIPQPKPPRHSKIPKLFGIPVYLWPMIIYLTLFLFGVVD